MNQPYPPFFGRALSKTGKKMSFHADSLRFHNIWRYTEDVLKKYSSSFGHSLRQAYTYHTAHVACIYEVNIMRIAICDDDILIIEQIESYIRTFFETKGLKRPEIVSFSSGEALLADKGDKDILFLDIEMPGINGIYVGKELKKANDRIIIFIVTSYPEYLDEAMRFHVFRYLSKPLDKQRFFRNMRDAVNLYSTITVKVPVETKQGIHTLLASSIIMIEAQGRNVIVHTTLHDFQSVHNMQYWLELLPKNCFFQTHRSFIVNFEHISDFDHSLVHLADNHFQAYLTKRKYSAFKDAYLLYLESTR